TQELTLLPYTTLFRSQEYLAYQKYHLAHDKAARGRIAAMRLIASVGMLVIGLLLHVVGRVNLVVVGVFAVLAVCAWVLVPQWVRSEEHTSELQSRFDL